MTQPPRGKAAISALGMQAAKLSFLSLLYVYQEEIFLVTSYPCALAWHGLYLAFCCSVKQLLMFPAHFTGL